MKPVQKASSSQHEMTLLPHAGYWEPSSHVTLPAATESWIATIPNAFSLINVCNRSFAKADALADSLTSQVQHVLWPYIYNGSSHSTASIDNLNIHCMAISLFGVP